MNMASVGILLIFTVIIQIAKTSFVKVECKPEKVGHYGQQSLLECVVKTTRDDAEIRVVTWKKEGVMSPLLVFNKGETKHQHAYSFAEPSWNVRNMNVSLLITNTAVEHKGDYNCMVLTDSGDDTGHTSLNVTAKYNKPTIRSNPVKITLNTDGALTCDSDGGYPKGQLRWFDEHNVELTEKAKMEVNLTPGGLFHLSSKLPLLQKSKYTCVVFNASGGKEEENTFEVPDAPTAGGQEQVPVKGLDPSSKIVAPAVVIGSLIAGLLLALLIYRRRSQQARRLSTTPLMSDHHQVPEFAVEEDGQQEMDETCRDSLA